MTRAPWVSHFGLLLIFPCVAASFARINGRYGSVARGRGLTVASAHIPNASRPRDHTVSDSGG